MEKKRFSIIGCEHAHIEIFIQEMLALGYSCAGIYETRNLALADSLSKQYGIPLVSEQAPLLAEDIAVVGTSAINNEKIDLIELCEQHGKSIMVDKPAATNRNGYERLQRVIERGQIEVGMLLTERFNPVIYTLKQLIDQGKLGKVLTLATRKPHRLNPDRRPPWFFSKEQCGGIAIDLLVHDFDLVRWLTGKEIQHAQGSMIKNIMPEHPGFYDIVSMEILLEHGISAQLYADWHTPAQSWTWGDGRIFITGTSGFAEIRHSGDPLISSDPLLLVATHEDKLTQITPVQPPMSITADFLQRVNGKSALLTANDILAATKATIDADETLRYIHNI